MMTNEEIARLAKAGDIETVAHIAMQYKHDYRKCHAKGIKQGRKIEEQRHEVDTLTARDDARQCVMEAAETFHRHVVNCDECSTGHDHIRHLCGKGRELACCVARCVDNAQQGGE